MKSKQINPVYFPISKNTCNIKDSNHEYTWFVQLDVT